MRSTLALVLVLVAAGLAFTLLNRGMPLVRNGLVYAKVSENVITHGYDPRPVVADSLLSYDKPILYAWVSAPLVRALGNHDGLRVTSFLSTAAYLLALVYFARAFRARLGAASERWFVWLCALGPCVFYQFWSAHPDGWFAALAVFAWGLCERIVAEPNVRELRRVLLLGACVYVAILLKNYGLVLLGSCPLYLLWHVRKLRAEDPEFGRSLLTAALVFGAIAALSLLALYGHNPLSRLEGEGGGVGQYASGELRRSMIGAWMALGVALLVQFHAALALAFTRKAWSRKLTAPLCCFAAPYVIGLMPFPTTFYNMRYFIPLFALAGLVLARGLDGWKGAPRGILLATHAVLGIALVLVFDVAPIYREAAPAIPRLEFDWMGPPLSLLDNLRMPLHLDAAADLAAIDAHVPAGATLYMLDVNYYRDAQRGVYEHAGLIRADIETVYVSSRDFHPPEREFYVYAARPIELGSLGNATRLAEHLQHVKAAE